jgi:hypothetical protein
MTYSSLDGWMPIRIDWTHDEPLVDWCFVGDVTFSDPFFSQTIDRCLRRPFSMLFRQHTPIGHLATVAAASPSVAPAGFVFHMSRCGSTLVSQMLAAHPEHIVISEADPIDSILRLRVRRPDVTEADRVAWLRALVGVYGRSRRVDERRLFIKFDSWNVHDLPLVHEAFPTVPWIFIHREPIEILASHARERGFQMVPGAIEPTTFGFAADAVAGAPLDDYAAGVLASICDAAVQHRSLGQMRFVDYADLPAAVFSEICPLFGVSLNDAGAHIDRMTQVSRFHAKRPYESYSDDHDRVDDDRDDYNGVNRFVTQSLMETSRELVQPSYERLLASRAGTNCTETSCTETICSETGHR